MSDLWFYIRDKKKLGPVGRAQLQQLALGGQIAPADMVMQEGAGKWQAAAEVPGLFPKPAPKSNPAMRPIVRPQPTAQGIQPRPQPPSSPGVSKPQSAPPPTPVRPQPTAQGTQPRPQPPSSPGVSKPLAAAPPTPVRSLPTAQGTPALAADQWFYVKDKKKVGPVGVAALKQLIAGGQLRGSDMVLPANSTKWQPLGAVPGLFGPPLKPAAPSPLAAKPAAPPAPAASAPPARPAAAPPLAAARPTPAAPPAPPPLTPVHAEDEDDEDEYEDDEDGEYEDDEEDEDDEDGEYEDDDDEEEAVDIAPLMERGSQLQAAREFPKAIAEYSQALRAAPDDPHPYNALAWVWATCPDDRVRDGKKAVEYAKQALAFMSDDHSYFRVRFQETLAAAHAETGDFTAASAAIDDAIIHAPFEDQRRLCHLRSLFHGEQPFRDEPGADQPVVVEDDDIMASPPDEKFGFLGKVTRSLNKLLNDRDAEEEATFLQAIAAQPDDDEPRIAYADWLLSYDDPKGEFIRLDMELDHLAGDDPRRVELDKRWNELLDEHAAAWLKPLADLNIQPKVAGAVAPGKWYERGLVTTVEIDRPDVLPAKAAALFAAAPALRRVRFQCQEVDVAGLAKLPQLAQLDALDLSGVELKVSGLRALLASPHLGRLTQLDLDYNDALGDEGIIALANAQLTAQLTALHLRSAGFRRKGLEALAASPRLARLEDLDLGSNDLDTDALRILLGARHLVGLKALALGTSRFGAEGIRALASSRALQGLESLRLSWCEIGPEGAKALAASPYLHKLTTLDLAGNLIKVEGAKALAASRILGKLELLDLDSNELGAVGARAVAASPFLANLRELSIGRNGLGDDGVASLAGTPHFARLSKLAVSENGISAKGAQAIANARHLANLTDLMLFDNPIGLAGAQALAASPHLKRLQVLGVNEKAVTVQGKTRLLERFGEEVVAFQ